MLSQKKALSVFTLVALMPMFYMVLSALVMHAMLAFPSIYHKH